MKLLLSLLPAFFALSLQNAEMEPLQDVSISPQEAYIEKYAALAVSEMYRSGVPASITLAQGLLESGAGMSILSRQSNNHFGIKCHNTWTGAKVYYDDDTRGECFRAYDDPADSFRDHSDFLRYRDRYKFLFDFEITDYKSWAYGLKKAGYATDPSYPEKLIRYIELYNLDRYDRMKPEDFAFENTSAELAEDAPADSPSVQIPSEAKTETMSPKQARKAAKAAERAAEKAAKERERARKTQQKGARHHAVVSEEEPSRLPDSPSEVETPHLVSKNARESFNFSLSRPVYELNGVPFILSEEGESYESIASDNDLFPSELLRYNDLSSTRELPEGTRVYLKPKKSAAAPMMDKFVAEGGESLWEISQRFAVKLSVLVRLNSLEPDSVLHDGDVILLREPAKEGRRK